MKSATKIEDIIGLGHTKLGFFKEVQEKMAQLQKSNLALERERRQVQAVLDGIADVIALVSLDFRVRTVNHSYFGTFPNKNPVGDFCYRVFRNQSQPCTDCPLLKAWHKNRIVRQDAIISVDDKNRQFEITASPLRDASNTPTDIILVKRDVTLQKEYQAKYVQAEKMATIGLLAAGVAHEINNPLAAISGFAEGLKRRVGRIEEYLAQGRDIQSDFRENIEIILSECNRCRDIVQGLLTFSPRKKAAFSLVNINDMILVVLRLLRQKLKKRSPDFLGLALDRDLPRIRGIAAELEQVILNLVLNAIDATREKGRITIRSRSENEEWICIDIEDTGCGIAPDDLPRLFEPFFTTKPVGQGIGIGLSTCYNIIRQHGGEILVESQLGAGSVFMIKLPVQGNRQ